MNSQTLSDRFGGRRAGGGILPRGTVLRLEDGPGVLQVRSGRIWLTRAGHSEDEFLSAGQGCRLGAGDAAVIESWAPCAGAQLQWLPSPRALLPVRGIDALRRRAWRFLAGLAGTAARASEGARWRFDAWARNAASSANRAQGNISAGESMACSGTVQ